MPLASWSTLHWFGPAAGAAVLAEATAVTSAGIKAFSRGGATVTASAVVSNADATRLVNRPATLTGAGAVTSALPKAKGRPSATIRVNTLSQDDVTGAVLEAQVAPGLTLRQALLDARAQAKLAAALSA